MDEPPALPLHTWGTQTGGGEVFFNTTRRQTAASGESEDVWWVWVWFTGGQPDRSCKERRILFFACWRCKIKTVTDFFGLAEKSAGCVLSCSHLSASLASVFNQLQGHFISAVVPQQFHTFWSLVCKEFFSSWLGLSDLVLSCKS